MIIILVFSYLVIFLLFIFIFILVCFLIINVFFELPFVGARKEHIKVMLGLSQIQKGDVIVDLGSGDGRLLIEAAKRGARAIGYEINPVLIIVSRIKIMLTNQSANAIVKKQSLWEADLKQADVIFVYALKKSMPKFENFVFKNAKKSAKVIANTNPFPKKKPKMKKGQIFLYIIWTFHKRNV